MAGQNPTGDNEAVLQGNPVSNIPADRAEGMLSLLKLTPHDESSSMGDLINQHHQTRLANAQMYSNATKAAIHSQLMIQHGIDPESGMQFDDPSYKGPTKDQQAAKYEANRQEAWKNYTKLAGVDQNTKGALAKAEQILNHILGGGAMQSAPGAPSNQGRQGGIPPPPTPQYGSSVTEKGVIPTPAPGTNVGEAGVALTPPPTVQQGPEANPLAAPMVEANTQFQQGLGRQLQSRKAVYQQDIQTRAEEAKKLFGETDSPVAQRYILTGQMPVAFPQKSNMFDPDTQEPLSYDKTRGAYINSKGEVIGNAVPQSMITPHQFKYMSPDGKSELPGKFVGGVYQDMQGNPLPEGTTVYARGLVPSETLRQVITYDLQNQPHLNTLETIRKPIAQVTGSAAQTAGPAPKAATSGGGTTGSAPKSRKGSGPLPPTPGGQAPSVDALGHPLGFSSGAVNQVRQAIVPVREAATQLFGDPTQPDLKGLADYADLSVDNASRKRIANALQLTMNGLEAQEKAKGGLTELLGNYGGLPQALVGSQTAVMQDVVGKLTPAEQEAFNAEMAAFGTVVGLRSLTKASGAQFSIKSLEREVPLFGINTFSKSQFYDKMSRLAEEVYNGSRNLPMPESERQFYQGKVKEYRNAAGGRKGGAAPAPTAGGAPAKSVDDQIMELIGGKKKS